jgi:hypothetical protein
LGSCPRNLPVALNLLALAVGTHREVIRQLGATVATDLREYLWRDPFGRSFPELSQGLALLLEAVGSHAEVLRPLFLTMMADDRVRIRVIVVRDCAAGTPPPLRGNDATLAQRGPAVAAVVVVAVVLDGEALSARAVARWPLVPPPLALS